MILVRRATYAAAAVVLATSFSGCCVPKGYMIGGDWSLQLNRIPWVECRTDCGGCSRCGVSDCADNSGPYLGGPVPSGAPQSDHPPVAGRLHPVPTRPAFSPQYSESAQYASSQPVPKEDAIEELPLPNGLESRKTRRQPRPSRLAQRQHRGGDTAGWIFSLPL